MKTLLFRHKSEQHACWSVNGSEPSSLCQTSSRPGRGRCTECPPPDVGRRLPTDRVPRNRVPQNALAKRPGSCFLPTLLHHPCRPPYSVRVLDTPRPVTLPAERPHAPVAATVAAAARTRVPIAHVLFRLDALALSVIATATWLAGWLSHSGIVSKPLNLSENFFDHLKAPSL